MSRYSATIREHDGFKIVSLMDSGADAEATIVADAGSNLIRFRQQGCEVLSHPDSLAELKGNGRSKYGTPILFPPNRVKKGIIKFKGREYKLPLNEPPEYHLHGELSSRPWEIIATGVSDKDGAFAITRFRFADHPDIMNYFPHSLVFTMTYKLSDGKMFVEGAIANEGPDEAPFAFGLHPYFNLPFRSHSAISLQVPASVEWPVSNQAFVIGEPSITALCRELRNGITLNDFPQLGVALVELDPAGDRTCKIVVNDEAKRYTIAYRMDESFPYVVLFRPDWSDAFSLEPYTYVTDAFNLDYAYERTGARGIRSAETISFATSLWVE
ncbi:aldose 1-epimerase [Cohnella faecalis]|uniref:Aldose 1-epimerase n=1 Tax=Cohnella faecalis TaxID=2315694 RepID=A0A398CKI8_9BACL|nr:aldose 1-epimerase [Cohnella faecalis]RIE00407.1 aldose 1-epimerase [Cohnella faecalis]